MDDLDDNIFDEDDALDYVMYEEVEQEEKQNQRHSGCLGVLLLFIVPTVILKMIFL